MHMISQEAATSKKQSFSGVYPHLAWTNGSPEEEEWECGTGAVVPWAGKLWYLTYPAHKPHGSHDKLFALDEKLSVEVYSGSVGGTHANRMIHRESEQLIIGPYFIDRSGQVRTVAPAEMSGRLTGVARHLSDPANKVIFYTMESGLYEVDVHTLQVTVLYQDPNDIRGWPHFLPGVHGKGAYSGQGRLAVSNNGNGGVLAEWQGQGDPGKSGNWTIVDANKYTEITGPGGLYGAPDDEAPLWALGWDHKSVLLNVCDNGSWKRFRLPMASYTHSADNGWFTEWPRIRDIGAEKWLMDMFGMLYEFPPAFSHAATAGIRPLAVHHKMIVDFDTWNGQLVMGCNDTSIQGNPDAGRCQSNLLFTSLEELKQWGKPQGWGGVWAEEEVQADQASEPFHFAGYGQRLLHLSHQGKEAASFTIELDGSGHGEWAFYQSITVPAGGYSPVLFPADVKAEWVRIRAAAKASGVTAWFAFTPAGDIPADKGLAAGITEAGARPAAARSEALLFPSNDMSLPLHAATAVLNEEGKVTARGLYEVDADMRISPVDNPALEGALRETHAPIRQVQEDAASLIVCTEQGERLRLPKGHPDFARASADGFRRCIREVVTERKLMNVHGTFYEVPDNHSGGVRKLQPVTTHNKLIRDFCSWRGMLVLSGVDLVTDGQERPVFVDSSGSSHVVYSADGQAGLWFGNVDDLRRFGAPAGRGGPWLHTPVLAGQPSDPYLMWGYRHKTLELSHQGETPVSVHVEVDVLANGTWVRCGTLHVAPGEKLIHVFPEGFAAHWVRLAADSDAVVTALFDYN